MKNILAIILLASTSLMVHAQELMEIEGAVKIGTTTNTNDGIIRYTGSDFEGRYNGIWHSLTQSGSGGSGSSLWTASGDNIYNNNIGWVGVGRMTPDSKFHVGGKIKSSYNSTSGEYVEIWHGGGNGYINTAGDGRLDFRHDGDNKMSLTDNGFLGVFEDSPAARVHINTTGLTATDYGFRMGGSGIFAVDFSGTIGGRFIVQQDGKVGIGTDTPDDQLQVIGHGRFGISDSEYTQIGHGGSHSFINAIGDGNLDFRHDGNDKMSITSNGYIGIGTDNPQTKLQVVNGTDVDLSGGYLQLGYNGSQNIGIDDNEIQARNNGAVSTLFMQNTGGNVSLARGGGKVYIGNPSLPGDYSLYVEKGVLAEEVKVALKNTADWSDDEFENTPTISQVKQSIQEKSHLYGMPSAKELKEEGIDVTTMFSKLLREIEWLNMHVIELSEQNEQMKKELDCLRSQIKDK